ncbi:undecaprenyl-diphosphate phosphatase [Catellatospora tritici]|uniref:undecaprenyl-diphosphate phosphatase n=1 Tax=Catellatospora tritici TaxID=2851566 RepID=UPI001C2D3102|nr:undecaprenyl-diphosphate phosphatase [Catellatospora tritici]MBV1854709.1 undecaprenyl-diphosphate phosphatase [Catellatospora tritici]
MTIWQAIILGIVEGITEFLPISSTGHLTITEKLMGLPIDDTAVTAFTAVIQIGAIAAVLVYFAKDIGRLASAWFKGVFSKDARDDLDYRLAWYVIAGSIPIGIVGFLGKDLITGPLRSLWFVAGSMIVWAGVMAFAEYAATQIRDEKQLTLKDTLIIGFAQCLALIPGVSRSGATITTGLLRDLDRVTATRLSFFLGVPALVAAGIYELPEALGSDAVSSTVLGVGTLVSFLVAYASIAWLLKFVAHHTLMAFVWYRVILGGAIIALLATSTISAT